MKIQRWNTNDLAGKVLKMIVQESDNLVILSGQDVKTGEVYVIHIMEKSRRCGDAAIH